MRTSNDGNGPLVPFDFECDLSKRHTPEAIQTRSYRCAFGNALYIRARVRFCCHFIVEDKYGAERGGSLANSSASDTVDDNVTSLVDGFMLVEGEVQ